MRLPPPLLALSPGNLMGEDRESLREGAPSGEGADLDAFVARVACAVEAGLCGVLLREPHLSARALCAVVTRLRASTSSEGAKERTNGSLWIGVHDHPEVAFALNRAAPRTSDGQPSLAVDGVHLGFRSLSVQSVRKLFDAEEGALPALGLSTHARDVPGHPGEPGGPAGHRREDSNHSSGDGRARDSGVGWSGVDYVVHGPVRFTPSKADLLEPIGMDGLARACAASACPVWAIGGLEPGDAADARARGAAGVAVLRGILGADDPAAAVSAYREGWEE